MQANRPMSCLEGSKVWCTEYHCVEYGTLMGDVLYLGFELTLTQPDETAASTQPQQQQQQHAPTPVVPPTTTPAVLLSSQPQGATATSPVSIATFGVPVPVAALRLSPASSALQQQATSSTLATIFSGLVSCGIIHSRTARVALFASGTVHAATALCRRGNSISNRGSRNHTSHSRHFTDTIFAPLSVRGRRVCAYCVAVAASARKQHTSRV